MTDLRPLLQVLPPQFENWLGALDAERLEEVRLRVGQLPGAVIDGKERPVCGNTVTAGELEQLLLCAAEHSCYAVEQSMRSGYLTLPGGHRLGFCGSTVMQADAVQCIKELSSVCIRVARNVYCAPAQLLRQAQQSILIVGPPGSGKTTLLRDCVRMLSESGQRVGVVDERGEIAAVFRGRAQLDVGRYTDILSGCSKSIGMMMLLRTMNPQWIAVDEITAAGDIEAMEQGSYCGVRFLATAHAYDLQQLQQRPLYQRLCRLRIFQSVLLLNSQREIKWERMA